MSLWPLLVWLTYFLLLVLQHCLEIMQQNRADKDLQTNIPNAISPGFLVLLTLPLCLKPYSRGEGETKWGLDEEAMEVGNRCRVLPAPIDQLRQLAIPPLLAGQSLFHQEGPIPSHLTHALLFHFIRCGCSSYAIF